LRGAVSGLGKTDFRVFSQQFDGFLLYSCLKLFRLCNNVIVFSNFDDEVGNIMAKSTTGLHLSKEVLHRLDELGKARDKSPHYLMKKAVERYLDLEESLETERQLVQSRWQTYELTGETLEHKDVKAWAEDLSV
jgi:predicted transcriptional regulator